MKKIILINKNEFNLNPWSELCEYRDSNNVVPPNLDFSIENINNVFKNANTFIIIKNKSKTTNELVSFWKDKFKHFDIKLNELKHGGVIFIHPLQTSLSNTSSDFIAAKFETFEDLEDFLSFQISSEIEANVYTTLQKPSLKGLLKSILQNLKQTKTV